MWLRFVKLAQSGQLPALLAREKGFGVPVWALLCLVLAIGAVRASLGMDVTSILPLVVAAAGCWLVAYIIVLRLRLPQHARPFRSPAFPLPQVLGILGMGYVFLNISPTPELAAPIYKNVAVIRGVPSAYSLVCTVLVMRRNPSDRIWLVRCKMAPSTMTEVAKMTGKAGMTGEGVNPASGKGMYPSLRKSWGSCLHPD